ncbi:NUDIX hydrolase [uncultured Roseobacter sp.]|uniref:NUDIX hydrolase n=1 Tax=uncultured Roseobacter sp. TaxID=114847 RepID=UPI002639F3B1|nr:NUDIX hydrolase [uncultured Roseobacter sp.]
MTRSYARSPEMNMPFHGAKLALLTPHHLVTLLRDEHPGLAHPGCWDLPGGGREGPESPVACALRETREELGLELDPAVVIWGRRFVWHGLGFWFFAARIEARVLREIVFGDEGQGWAAMTPRLFYAHPKVIAHFKDRLRICLTDLEGEEKPPADVSGGR